MKHRRPDLAGALGGLLLILLLSGCHGRQDADRFTPTLGAPQCSQLIARIEAGNYTTYVSQRFWTEDVVRVQELNELAEMKEAYPWLIRAMNHRDKHIAETARELFVPSGTPGAIEAESLLEWYDVPDNELVWKGFMWEPRFGYIPEDTEAGQQEIAPRCRQLISQIDAGEYTTFHPEARRKPDLVIIREMQEIFLWKGAYRWLIDATGRDNPDIRDTAEYYFSGTSLPGRLTPERLRMWYDVPETDLQRTGKVWEPRLGRVMADNQGLWYVRASGQRINLCGPTGFAKASSAGRVQYAYPDVDGSEELLCLVECFQDGRILRTRVLKPGSSE